METITMYVTGRSVGNPGPAAIGVVVVDSADQVLLEHSATIGNATDDYAAYQAVVEALTAVHQHLGDMTTDTHFELKLDNEFVKQQINGEEPVTDPRSVSHFIHIHNLRVEHFPQLSVAHISREQNSQATSLVNAALDE
jgi:ribonuclease HI/probable phosphoglycerate mutase